MGCCVFCYSQAPCTSTLGILSDQKGVIATLALV